MTPAGGGRATARGRSSEIVSLADRMAYMQALRGAFAVAVLASSLLAKDLVGATLSHAILITALYLLLSAASEGFRRVIEGRALGLVAMMVLVDGVYLAWAMYATGGTHSPLRFLAYLHIIAVSLLASYRTGLKIAIWHSLLYFVVFYAQAAGILTPLDGATQEIATGRDFYRTSVFNVLALLLVAAATATFSALNERELRRRKSDLEALSEMAAEVESETEPGPIAQKILDRLCKSFGFKRGIVLAGAEGKHGVLAKFGPAQDLQLEEGVDELEQKASDQRRVVLVRELDSRLNPRLASFLPLASNLVVAPLFAERRSIGTLIVENPRARGGRVERRVIAMVEQFAAHAALALRGAWLLEQIQKLADTDPLTGLANRRVFEANLEREVSRASRTGEQVTLVMFDLDHFKNVNDNYGHQTGDEVLRSVGRILTTECRDFDTPARYGGEEFAVVLPSCSSRESLVVAERLRQAIGKIKTMQQITVSGGVATFPSHAGDSQTLLRAADESLYESKRAGRDRVTRSRRRVAKPAASARRSDSARSHDLSQVSERDTQAAQDRSGGAYRDG